MRNPIKSHSPKRDPATGRYTIGGNTPVRVWQVFSKISSVEAEPYRSFKGMGKSMEEFETKYIRGTFNPRMYDLVFDGRLDADHNPNCVWDMLQGGRPIELSQTMFSLSIGDIIELDGNGKYLMAVAWGFEDVTPYVKGVF